jgi:hypothetical protein
VRATIRPAIALIIPVTAVMIAESESPGVCAICIGTGAGAGLVKLCTTFPGSAEEI